MNQTYFKNYASMGCSKETRRVVTLVGGIQTPNYFVLLFFGINARGNGA
jgi:hypothetical protein